MKLHAISSSNGKLIAIVGGGDLADAGVRVRPGRDQYVHELELPAEAASLKPHEIYRRLKIHAPGHPPVFTKD
jgi:hypothetical protein